MGQGGLYRLLLDGIPDIDMDYLHLHEGWLVLCRYGQWPFQVVWRC